MHLFFYSFFLSLGAMFPIVNPIGQAPFFYIMTVSNSAEERHKLSLRIAFYVFLILTISLVTGEYILKIFGVTLNDIRIGGGLLVASIAWKMLGNSPSITEKEHSAAMDKEDIALTPMATPILAGPGAMTFAIGLASFGATPVNYAGYIAGFFVISLITVITFYFSDYLVKCLGHNALGSLNRILGFLILAIGVDLMVTGIKNAFFLHG
ncbi:MAG: MarC family protein [Chthoniobacterales bacterium]